MNPLSVPGSIVVLPSGMTPMDVVTISPKETEVEEAMRHYYNRDPDALANFIRRLVRVIHKAQE